MSRRGGAGLGGNGQLAGFQTRLHQRHQAAIADLERVTADETTLLSLPRIFQVHARRPLAADEARWVSRAIGRPVDLVIANTGRPSPEALMRYAAEHKQPLELGDLDPESEPVLARLWCTEIARHDRRRLAFAVWTVLSQRLLNREPDLQQVSS